MVVCFFFFFNFFYSMNIDLYLFTFVVCTDEDSHTKSVGGRFKNNTVSAQQNVFFTYYFHIPKLPRKNFNKLWETVIFFKLF